VVASRYREARTLVRRLGRLPGEGEASFRAKLARLRKHFERFNVDVSELCQWLMGLRKQHCHKAGTASFGVLGDFLLHPESSNVAPGEAEADRWRLLVFDAVAGICPAKQLTNAPMPRGLPEAMEREAKRLADLEWRRRNTTQSKLIDRLAILEPAHRLVLLKAAAEWVVSRYQRGLENWAARRGEWEKERHAWEKRHPALSEEVRQRFTEVFKSLNDPERTDKPGVRRKNPRICPYERLRANIDNCIYAGEKGHGALCWKYAEFVKARKTRQPQFNDKRFAEDAEKVLPLLKQGMKRHQALQRLFPRDRPHGQLAQQRFNENWTAYLQALGLKEERVVNRGRLPHCLKIGETHEKSKCAWNPHTELCKQYKRALDQFDEETLKLEPLYREWRRDYLAGPGKPQFRYPSSRELPMPKIFGAGFHEIDFDRSILRLRLEDMPEGEWIEFGFAPWPRGYRPSKEEVKVKGAISSVHVNFVGVRARAGFRFDVRHRASRFQCTQDELDQLRSRAYPRRAQDREYLDAARKRLLESFAEGEEAAKRELRLLAVDLGETGACAAVYHGHAHQKDVQLAILKINRLYTQLPEALEPDPHGRPEEGKRKYERDDPRGVRKEHMGRHLKRMADGAASIAARRQGTMPATVTMAGHDFRGLKRHVTWMIRDWARHNAARIVAAAEEHGCDLIVFESLRGQKVPGYHELSSEKERDKRQLAMLSYGRIRHKVREKAVERGMRVVMVPDYRSSRLCSSCGHEQCAEKWQERRWRENKKKRLFKCVCGEPAPTEKPHHGGSAPDRQRAARRDGPGPGKRPGMAADQAKQRCRCGAEMNSDANAARVLARVFWGEITPPASERSFAGSA